MTAPALPSPGSGTDRTAPGLRQPHHCGCCISWSGQGGSSNPSYGGTQRSDQIRRLDQAVAASGCPPSKCRHRTARRLIVDLAEKMPDPMPTIAHLRLAELLTCNRKVAPRKQPERDRGRLLTSTERRCILCPQANPFNRFHDQAMMISDARSAIASTVALILQPGISGITEASTIRSPSMPCTRSF